MKIDAKAYVRDVLIALSFMLLTLVGGCAYLERPYTYHEFDGVFAYYKTQDTAAYRELLPQIFDMPSEPMVMVFVMDYYKMNKTTEPYKEAAVFLLAGYRERLGWHCVTMPVTTDEARVKGIKYLGYPKILGDVGLQCGASSYTGTLKLKDKSVMTVNLATKSDVSKAEEAWFEKFSGLAGFNILNGKVYEPQFGGGSRVNLLKVARAYPEVLTVKTGVANLSMDAEAAAAYSAHLQKIFSIKPAEIVLAYYMKNTAKQTFGAGKFSQK
jgi:acetoacetate decarboxylase